MEIQKCKYNSYVIMILGITYSSSHVNINVIAHGLVKHENAAFL